MANNLPPFDEPRENYLQELQDETVAQFEHMQQLQREKKQKEFERQFGEKAAQQNEYISQYNKTTLAQERALLAKNVIKGDWEGDEAFFAKWESFAYFVCAVHTCQRDLIVDVPVNYSVAHIKKLLDFISVLPLDDNRSRISAAYWQCFRYLEPSTMLSRFTTLMKKMPPKITIKIIFNLSYFLPGQATKSLIDFLSKMPKEFRHVTVNPNRLSEVVNLIKNTSTFFSGFTVYCSKENWGMMLKQGNCWLGNKIHHYELDYNYSYDMEYFPRLLPIGDFLEQDPDSKHGSMMLKQKKEWGEWRGDENNELNRFFMHHQQILRNYFRKPVDSLKQTALGKILLKYTLPLHSTVIYPRFLSLLGMIQRRVKNILCSPVRFNDPPDEKLEDKDGREEYNQSVPPLTYLLPIYLDPQKEQPHISALREFINSNERVNTKTLKPEKRIELVRIFAKFLEKEGERWTQMSPQEQAEYRIINEIHGAQERKVWARNEMLRLRCSNSRCPTNIDTNKKLLRDAYPQYFHVPSNLIYHEERGHAAKYRVRGKKAEQNKNKDREFIKNRVVQESGSIMPTTFDEENHYAQRPLGRTVVRTDCPHCGFELTRYQEIK